MTQLSSWENIDDGCPRGCQRVKQPSKPWRRSRACDCHHAGVEFRVSANGVYRRYSRPVLSAICFDDRSLTIISAINAMTMAPARAVTLIKPHKEGHPKEALPTWGVGLIAAYFAYRFLFPIVASIAGVPLPSNEHGAEPVVWSWFHWEFSQRSA